MARLCREQGLCAAYARPFWAIAMRVRRLRRWSRAVKPERELTGRARLTHGRDALIVLVKLRTDPGRGEQEYGDGGSRLRRRGRGRRWNTGDSARPICTYPSSGSAAGRSAAPTARSTKLTSSARSIARSTVASIASTPPKPTAWVSRKAH